MYTHPHQMRHFHIRSPLLLWCLSLFIWPLSTPAQTTQVLYLNGNGAYVELPAALFHQFTNNTIETWVKWEDIQNWSRVFDFGQEGNAMVLQSEKSSRTLNFAIYDRNGNRHRIQAHNAIPVGHWFHIAVTSGSQGMALFINGESVGTDAYTGGLEQVTGGHYYIGRSNWSNDKPFQGYVSEFRMWNYQRSQTDIQRTMQRRLTGKEKGLVAYWHLDHAENSQIPSATGTHMATLRNNARIIAVPPIARYLIPGEIKKDIQSRQTSAQAHLDRGDYVGAYRDYQAVLDLSPGDEKTRSQLLLALEKGHIEAALLPIQAKTIPSERAYVTAYTTLTQNRPAYIHWITPTTLHFALYEQGISTHSTLQEYIQAAKAWHIRLLVHSTLQDIHIATSRPKRDTQIAYLRLDHQTTSDSLRTVHYNIIKQQATGTGQATLQMIDVKTGRTLDTHTVQAEIDDQIEYASYSGDVYALWTKRGSRMNRLINQEPRFLNRNTLKTEKELTEELLQELGRAIAQRVQSVLTLYTP